MKAKIDKEHIFGLDVGTRTVIGIVGYMENEQFVIEAHACIEHEERAMLDGQIHDIQKVVTTVQKVKATLEKTLGFTLKKVAIAAAGRVLNTFTVEVSQELEELREINSGDIKNLEFAGIEAAKKVLEKKRHLKSIEYFCVGYSVIHYYLEDYAISNLIGHKGTKISAQLLATFLPKAVVDSLYVVTDRVGLEVVNLTLEPIAAINAIIPENLRLLNLALVDIGAGTSDIAITKDGSVVSYGMIPIAGDEVTEAIVHHYLVDFNTAENIKHQLNGEGNIIFTDIIGLPYEVSKEEVEKIIEPVVENLTATVADKILELNGGKATNAVFCVGGGSQIDAITAKFSEKLQIPKQRVAVRTGEQVTAIANKLDILKTPDIITPLGICLTCAKEKNNQFTMLTVNEVAYRLLNTKKLTVLDAMIEAQIDHTNVFAKKGKTLMFKLNGERIRIKGQSGRPAVITLNGKIANMDMPIVNGDEIHFIPATKGADGKAFLTTYIEKYPLRRIHFKEETFTLPFILKNRDAISLDTDIEENDSIEIVDCSTLGELLDFLKIDSINQLLTVNFKEESESYLLQDKDTILIQERLTNTGEEPLVGMPAEIKSESIPNPNTFMVEVNGKPVLLDSDKTYMFANIFDYIDFDLRNPKGTIQLLLNGANASVADTLQNGDVLEIYWKK